MVAMRATQLVPLWELRSTNNPTKPNIIQDLSLHFAGKKTIPGERKTAAAVEKTEKAIWRCAPCPEQKYSEVHISIEYVA